MRGTTVVTGASGFIGANLVRSLLQEGRNVIGVDNLSGGTVGNLDGLELKTRRADLRLYQQALSALEDADTVFHLAARVGSLEYLHGSRRAELDTLQSNLVIDTNVFRACKELGVQKIVYASSVSVYPISKQDTFGVEFAEPDVTPYDPEGGYGWAKLLGELQLELLEDSKSACARIFNAYGEYSAFGQAAQVVPALIRKAINYPKEEFIVWGSGSQTRNLLYVEDCVKALMLMEAHASQRSLVLNIGNPETTTIRSLAEVIVGVSGKQIEVRYDVTRPVGPVSRIPNIERARRMIGWAPRVSLREGVERTYNWMSSRLAGA